MRVLPRSRLAVALAALLFTGIFFAEYLPTFRRVHIPYDLDGFHYSLFDYAFQALKHGRIPQWDPTMYSGMTFVGNVQAALFYPPTWIMYAASWGREVLPYQAVQDLTLAHVWLAFTLCFFWLRAKRLDPMACALGAGVFAYSGYLCTQLQHFGLVAAYAWFPLGLWSIDEAVERRSWKPLWKLTLASALAFLAGYPPIWFVFAFVAGVYALAGAWRWRSAAGVGAALLASLALAAVQVLPVREAAQFREPEERYGGGIKDVDFYLSYFVPNYFDFGPDRDVHTNPGRDYLYLGAPGLLGLAWALRRRVRGSLPAAAAGLASLAMVTNPWNAVWAVLQHSSLLADLARSYYFLAGVAVAAAELSARGLDAFLRAPRPVPHVWVRASIVAMGVWAIAEAIRRPADFAAGWASWIDAVLMLAVFTFAVHVYRAQRGDLRVWMGLAILISVGIDYKVFGTVKRFNSSPGAGPRYSLAHFDAMNDEVFRELRANAAYRVILGEFAPHPAELRHVGLLTPQGFDPLLSAPYRRIIDRYATSQDDRQFQIDPGDGEALRLFGARYWITSEHGAGYRRIAADPRFRRVQPHDSYYRVFEFLNAGPPWGWEGAGEVELRSWEPERRVFRVRAREPGVLTFSEQYFPGWSALVDGRETPVELWNTAFQSVRVPAGEHTVEFRYRSTYLAAGAWISVASLAGLLAWARISSGSRSGRGYHAVSG
jgi:hypothetical protein